jgi:hypothetical protein
MKKLIGLVSRAGGGKDQLAMFLQFEEPSYKIKKFATKIKTICGVLCNVDPTRFESQDFKKEVSPFGGLTYRELLQKVGTESFRDVIDPDIWVKALFAEYNNRNWIITDVRFPNEADEIRRRGGVLVRIKRDSKGSDFDQHTSETALNDYQCDAFIDNNGTLEELKTNAKLLLLL